MGKTLFDGRRTLRDEDTGELIHTQVIERVVGEGDAGFHKIWLGHILELVEEVGNAKMVVLVWLLKNADGQNQISASLRDIAKATGVGVATVQRLMAALVNADVVTRASRYGAWRLNPEVVFAGSGQKRMNVLIRYRHEKQRDLFEQPAPHKAEMAEAA
jgi:DNA-binding MarR family transcriptional regulator